MEVIQVEKQCEQCGELIGNGGDTYFLPEANVKVIKTTAYVTYDLEESERVLHFLTELECVACKKLQIYESVYAID